MFLKGNRIVLIRISISTMGVIPTHLKKLKERNYQIAEKEEDDLRKQEEDIFDDDEDNTITVSGQDCQNSFLMI